MTFSKWGSWGSWGSTTKEPAYKTYEFTAFTKDGLFGGDKVDCGTKFEMPNCATTCFSVKDDDSCLSGDKWGKATDSVGQTASIEGTDGSAQGNGCAIYADNAFWVQDEHGKKYLMIEIEQEGGGSYYTFHSSCGVPPAGAELCITAKCDVDSNWIKYDCLDGGCKTPPTGTITGTVWCDDCDGIQDQDTVIVKGDPIFTHSVTYESVKCTTANVDCYGDWKSTGKDVIDLVVGADQGHKGNSKDNTIVELDKGGVWTREFSVKDGGTFCLSFDTYTNSCISKGDNKFDVKINGVVVETVTVSADGKIELSVELKDGNNKIEFVSKSGVSGFGAGIDDVNFAPLVEETVFAEMPKEGVTVILLDANGNEVATTVTDADGNYTFADVAVGDYQVMGVAPDGTKFTIKDAGSDDSIDSDVGSDGKSGVITVTSGGTVDVDMGLCDEPGTGTITGTVWCDDCDGLQETTTTTTKGDPIFTHSVTYESVKCTTANVDCYGDWKSTGYDVIDLVVGDDQGHKGNAKDNTIVELDKGGVWTREFTVEDGGTYCLTFDTYKNSCISKGDNKFDVKINGVVVQTVIVAADGKIELAVELLDGANKIEFVSKSGVSGFGAGIDDVNFASITTETSTEMPKEGVTIILLDANGNEVATTVTDADGNYTFSDVPVGDYQIMGVAPDGTKFTIKDVNNNANDDIDSDVGSDGKSDMITVVEDSVTDIDLGLCPLPEAATLAGRYFFDENDNGVDDDGPDNGIAGVKVELMNSDGSPVYDLDGNLVEAVYTDSNGDYLFVNLPAGEYQVKFTDDVSGMDLIEQNVGMDDTIDSDAEDIGGGMSLIDDIPLAAGEHSKDNDAGVYDPNEDPTATDDAGMGCADKPITVDLSDNYADADSASVGITSIGGIAITDGQTVELSNGVFATLDGDTFIFDGEEAYKALDIGEQATTSVSYTVTDSDGGTATANIDLTFCGDANTADSLDAGLKGAGPIEVTFSLQATTAAGFVDAYTLDLLSSTKSGIDLGTYVQAYCIDSAQEIEFSTVTTANVYVATEANAAAVSSNIDATKIDSINWLLNNDMTLVDNGDGNGLNFTDFEVQEAIWVLMNGQNAIINKSPGIEYQDNGNGVRDGAEIGTLENVQNIVDYALDQGDGFSPVDGDIIGLILDPTSPSSQQQPFIIGVEFDKIDCLC